MNQLICDGGCFTVLHPAPTPPPPPRSRSQVINIICSFLFCWWRSRTTNAPKISSTVQKVNGSIKIVKFLDTVQIQTFLEQRMRVTRTRESECWSLFFFLFFLLLPLCDNLLSPRINEWNGRKKQLAIWKKCGGFLEGEQKSNCRLG